VPGYLEGTFFFRLPVDIRVFRHRKVLDRPAFFAYKMIMRLDPGLEPVKRASQGQFLDFTLLLEHIQIS
jgi:hypothetical protein